MTTRNGYLLTTAAAIFLAAAMPLTAGAQDQKKAQAAPHPAAHAAPHPQVHAAPHPVAHAAPHVAPRRAAGAVYHATPAIQHARQQHTPAAVQHVEHAHRTPHTQPTRQTVQHAQPSVQTQTQNQAHNHERHAREHNRAQPSAQTKIQAQPNAQTNIQAQPNAAVQSNAQLRHAHHRHGGAGITTQAARQGRFASHFNATLQASTSSRHAHARTAHLAARRAWHRGQRASFVPWYGPVFWPYAYSDIFDYAFWPGGYDDGYWDYVYDDFFDGLFWGEQGPPDEYVYAEPYAEPTPSVRHAAVAELCEQPGTGITAWPFADITRKVGLNGEQKGLLDELRAAAGKAAATFKTSCPPANDFSLTPPGRLQAMSARLGATLQAVRTVKPALAAFYNSLSDEQKERFNELGPQGAANKLAAADETNGASPQHADNCKQPKPGLANLPIEKIADVVKPTDAQQGNLDKLSNATDQAVSIMQAACPDETPLTPIGRLDATEKRLQAMIEAANAVKPALDGFYGSLSNEQKARFNNIGGELAQANGNG